MLVLINTSVYSTFEKYLHDVELFEVTRMEHLLGLNLLAIVATCPADDDEMIKCAKIRIEARYQHNPLFFKDTRHKQYYFFGNLNKEN